MTLWKVHHGIMKADAEADYDCVLNYCKENGLPTLIPKKQTCKGFEDTTACMISNIPDAENVLKLHRGVSFYRSIYKEIK